MKKVIHFLLVFSFICFGFSSTIASPTPNQLLNRVYKKLMKTKDYTVDVKIKSDIPMIKIMPVNAKLYFKQPNLFKIESTGIAILPKQGLSNFATTLKDSNSYMAVISGNEVINKVKTQIINIIPNEDTGDLIVAKFWIDTIQSLTMKSQITTRSNGTMLIQYFYGNAGKSYGLPDSMVFIVDVKKFKIPKALAADVNKGTKKPTKEEEQKNKKGQIYIRFKNYSINKGVDSKVFKK
jgi:outer membrane lipoprotein-sorting protein